MVTYTNTASNDLDDNYDEMDSYERIRVTHDSAMPVGRAGAAIRGRRRSQPSKRTHRAPQHCRGAQHRRIRKWR